jgi:MFS transporter, SP family, sugar:H+ symporter
MPYWRKLFSTGYINPTDHMPDVTSSQTSLIVSILSAGTTIGALASAPIADHIGRRLAMIVNTFVFTFGVILQIAAVNIPLFVAGRFFAGLGVGLLSATIPLYQSETAPKWVSLQTVAPLTPLRHTNAWSRSVEQLSAVISGQSQLVCSSLLSS